ncbi:AraC family transcriptional regulator [Phreatobacter stygius]|uniref:Helix-turn-helix domain-containing protein n=1 Tax=Phreatobacter stygius TaxID=1940610 RepID=A0A4D7BGW5_9HYPH|nr:helix-turn-helix domain-containing protein [Phreatobacter stygius]QCI67102.1 helix-turn-helix domain-containing protein [Phreatobacter stygius]
MLSWSTDELRPHERFDHWREVRGKHLAGVTMDIDRDKRGDFRGRFSSMPLGSALLSEIQATAYDVSRNREDINRLSSDSLRISHLIEGPGWCDTPRGRVYMDAGAISTSYSDLPFALAQRPGSMHVRLLRIPIDGHEALARSARDFHTETLAPDSRYSKLIRASFLSLADAGAQLAAAEADSAIGHLAQLVLLSRGAIGRSTPESREAVRAAHLTAARRIIAGNLYRQDLGVETLAKALVISVRQVHMLFEPTGMSCHRTITAMRLDEVRRLLAQTPERPVIDIAFACGFDSLATFYRAFRRAEGATPGDYRHAVLYDSPGVMMRR